MKIQKLTPENRPKAYALLRRAFAGRGKEADLLQRLHEHGKPLHEWACIHTGKIIAYIAFSNAYHGADVCGLHLGPLAVSPEFQKQGVGSELLRFALRQESIKDRTLFVLGAPGFFRKFGFEPCQLPICPLAKNNASFLSIRNDTATSFPVGYEAEFKTAATSVKSSTPSGTKGKRRR